MLEKIAQKNNIFNCEQNLQQHQQNLQQFQSQLPVARVSFSLDRNDSFVFHSEHQHQSQPQPQLQQQLQLLLSSASNVKNSQSLDPCQGLFLYEIVNYVTNFTMADLGTRRWPRPSCSRLVEAEACWPSWSRTRLAGRAAPLALLVEVKLCWPSWSRPRLAGRAAPLAELVEGEASWPSSSLGRAGRGWSRPRLAGRAAPLAEPVLGWPSQCWDGRAGSCADRMIRCQDGRVASPVAELADRVPGWPTRSMGRAICWPNGRASLVAELLCWPSGFLWPSWPSWVPCWPTGSCWPSDFMD
ncbi:hypothetical protein BVRB_2g041300 [Beta vulgaris subsp. vulgaris]|nr:hypothetical protein BVRB_2g041300 [Beta vulgaris subsp. vulgaris]